MFVEGLEGWVAHDEIKERSSDFENSEEDRRLSRICNLRKKAINAMLRLSSPILLRKEEKAKSTAGVQSVSIEDIWDATRGECCQIKYEYV